MNTITLPKNKYLEILEKQEQLQSNFKVLQNFVFEIAQDEVNEKYLSKLSKIENQISSGQKRTFRDKKDLTSFLKNLR